MNENDSGVAKWSVLRSTTRSPFGRAPASRSAGAAKSFSPITTRTGFVIADSDAGSIGGDAGRFMIAVRAALSLPGAFA